MNYPLISEYISSILSAEDNLGTKTTLRPVLSSTGDPIMTSGNFAVVFKMVDVNDNKHYAMKCFLREQPGREESYIKICNELEFVESQYLLKTEYLPNELFVDTTQSDETEFPVLLMEWVEGSTLGAFISENYSDSFKISQVSYNLSKMASWLLSQDFAHGDIKPDNIIVKENGNLVLVDYDGMYVPSMRGSLARENGSPNFRHPKRTERDFDEHIDDFSLAVLNLTLKLLSLDVATYSTIFHNDYCIFSESDYHDLYHSKGIDDIAFNLEDSELQKLWGIFLIALSEKKLSSLSFRLLSLALPSKDGNYSKLTEKLTDEEIKRKSGEGIIVDDSGKRLIAAKIDGDTLRIPESIEIICSSALQRAEYESIILPNSIRAIGGIAFANNSNLKHINIPKGVVFMEHNNPFGGCVNLKDIRVDSPNYIIENDLLYSIDYQILYASLFNGNDDEVTVDPATTMISGNAFWQRDIKTINLPKHLSIISGSGAFGFCENLKTIEIPNSVIEIGNCAFFYCTALERIRIPNSVTEMGSRIQKGGPRGMFQGCDHLTDVTLSNRIEYLGERFFWGCKSLKHVSIPDSVNEICACAFEDCQSLEEITIPSSVRIIRDNVFRKCKSLKSIYIPDTVQLFDEKHPDSIASRPTNRRAILEMVTEGIGMFSRCLSLEKVRLPNCMKVIGIDFFKSCESLTQIDIPNTVTEIKHGAFEDCHKLGSITLPSQLQAIHSHAFSHCLSLSQITLPPGVTSLEKRAFESCDSLRQINLPSKLNHLDGNPFPGCHDLDLRVESDAFIVSDDSLYSFNKQIIHSYWGGKICGDSLLNKVLCIDRFCFSRSEIETISIPGTIKEIKDQAFSNCPNLKYAALAGITKISRYLFQECKSLQRVSIPSSVTTIKEGAFNGCSSLSKIEIPGNVQSIGDCAFEGCVSLKSIVLPSSVKEITRDSSTRGLFRGCTGLSTITLSSFLPSLEEYDFEGCDNLTRVIVAAGDRSKYKDRVGKYYRLFQYEDDLPF